MATRQSKWTDQIHSPISVLNHAQGLHLERFTSDDLDEIAGCDDVVQLSLRSSKMAEPLDLARLAHITGLRKLSLDRLKFSNLAALRALPHLQQLVIENCMFSDFDALNGFKALKYLFLWHNKLEAFPAGLDLPQLASLYLSDNRITDLGFARSYPTLANLHADNNQITDLSPLAVCPRLTELHVNDNPVARLAPLAGMRFSRFYADARHNEEKEALQLLLPELPHVQDAERVERWRVADLMRAHDWAQLYAITDLALLGEAFASLVHGHYDEDTLRGVLAHPVPGAFDAMLAEGLSPHYSTEAELMVNVLSGYGERLIPVLTQCFHTALARPWYRGNDFSAGKMKLEHAMVMRILVKAASPAHTDLFLAYFNERERFSEMHLYYYKKLLDVVGKTQAPQLVEPVIDLLRLEKHIIGGDAAFMKKIFKAIAQLGGKADAAVLASRYDVAAETRPDVVAAYEATLARLGKKKA